MLCMSEICELKRKHVRGLDHRVCLHGLCSFFIFLLDLLIKSDFDLIKKSHFLFIAITNKLDDGKES